MPFQPFNPRSALEITRQDLPHWRQEGTTYFVTSRLADSLPSALIKRWAEERACWLAQQGIATLHQLDSLGEILQTEYHRRFTARWHEWLDAGHGECWLRQPDLAALVAREFMCGHPGDYELDTWVVMPNHFHALLRPLASNLSRIMQRWKGASARRANLHLQRSGTFWQNEPYDHIVRHEPQFWHYRRYIAENPAQARLSANHYLLGSGLHSGFTPESLLAHLNADSDQKVAGTSVTAMIAIPPPRSD